MQIIFTFFALGLTLSVFSQTATSRFQDFDDCQIYFSGLFDEPSTINGYGYTTLDMGSISAGRLAFRISDVQIKMVEKQADEPGCLLNCEPRIIIYFKCKHDDCIADPVLPEITYPEGAIQEFDLKKGKKMYEFLKEFQLFIHQELAKG